MSEASEHEAVGSCKKSQFICPANEIDELFKDVAISFLFFYVCYNSSGANTSDGFNAWWAKNRSRFISN